MQISFDKKMVHQTFFSSNEALTCIISRIFLPQALPSNIVHAVWVFAYHEANLQKMQAY